MTQPVFTPASDRVVASRISNRRRPVLVLLVTLWAAVYVSGLFTPALLDDADSVHAEAAREMLLRHDWVTLHADGIRYLEKAPLLYWGMAASFRIFGVSEWTARLPLALGVLGLVLASYALGRHAYGEEAGLWSGILTATSLGIYIFTRFQIPDALVALWLTLGMLFFLRTLEEEPPSRAACWGLAITTALNVLTKGLIGLVFPAAIILVFLILSKNLRHLGRMRLLSSSLIFFAVAAPWHVLASLRNPSQGVRGFAWFYFVNEHFLRYLNKRVPRDYDTVPLLVFWALLLVWLLPWSVFLPQATRDALVRWRERPCAADRRRRAGLLFLVWGVVIVGFFSFSTRQEYYSLPPVPAIALLIAGWLQQENDALPDSRIRRAGRISSAILFVFGLAGFAGAMALLLSSRAVPAGTDLAELLKRNPQEYALSFGHIFDLTPRALGLFRGPLLATAIALLAGTGANLWCRYRGTPAFGNAALAMMTVALLLSVHAALVTFSPILSSKALAEAIRREYRAGDTIVIAGEYESGSTLNFYTGQPVHILHQRTANLWYGSLFPDAPQIFETQESFKRLWLGPHTVFLWADAAQPPQLTGLRACELAHRGGKYIFTNHPLQPSPCG
jgi:4-amino-4-deoxy-L-arabinose transferase-like glycosyltransferase